MYTRPKKCSRTQAAKHQDNMMARLRYQLELKKQHHRDAYAAMCRKDKKSFAKRFEETQDLDEVLTWKAKQKKQAKVHGHTGLFSDLVMRC